MSMPSEFKVKAVGMSFVPGYPENLYALNEIVESSSTNEQMEPIPAVLVRNPANAFDANAIEIHVPALGDQGMIGHVPAPVAARLAPCLDAGEIWASDIWQVAIHPDHPENPGIHLRIGKIGSDEPF